MKNKLLLYVFAGMFSFLAVSCEEELLVDVPTEVTRTMQVSWSEFGAFVINQKFDISSDEFKENREKMKDLKVESLEFVVVDNLPEGSGNPSNLQVTFDAGETRVSTGAGVLSGSTFEEQLNSMSPEYLTQLKQVIEYYVLDDPNPFLNIDFQGVSEAPMDYTVTLTMKVIIQTSVQ